MWKQVFCEIHSTKHVDTKALLRELGIRNGLMQFTSLSKPGIVDENINFNPLFFDIMNYLSNILFGCYIKVHTFHAIVMIEGLPLL